MDLAVQRASVAGCGAIFQQAHLAVYRTFDASMRIVALAEPDPEARHRAGEELGLPPGAQYEDIESLLEQERPDWLIIASPPGMHLRAIRAAVRHRSKILCEKPLCLDPAEADWAAGEVVESGVFFSMVHNYLYQPGWVRLLHERERKDAGDPATIWLHERAAMPWNYARSRWRTDPAIGGGPLWEQLYHFLYVAEALMKSPIADAVARTWNTTTDFATGDTCGLMLLHQNGRLSMAQCTWAEAGEEDAVVHIQTAKGLASYRYWQSPATIEWTGERPETIALPEADALSESGHAACFHRAFKAAQMGAPPPHPIGEAARFVRLLGRAETRSRPLDGVVREPP